MGEQATATAKAKAKANTGILRLGGCAAFAQDDDLKTTATGRVDGVC